jgi:Tol biopolymer transport system component
MSLLPGTKVGPYEIVSTLGVGGMGEVYRARDPRLRRDVAIKALPDAMAADSDRVARFHREAQVLASLNHPSIAAIHGLEETGGCRFLILELVDGETLAERLKSGPVPLRAVLMIACQIAEALEAAHERGIIHRDLKPANVALTPDDRVKVLDFGLAKSFDSTDGGMSGSTITSAGTQMGVMLGTASYMSPEQARGLPVDKRSDVWAFGCVLYELVTGRRAFPGQTATDAIAAILEREPEWRLVPASVPPRITWLLQRCLAKDRKQRLHDIADARIEIAQALSNPAAGATTSAPATRTRERLAWAIAAVALAGLAVTLWIGRNPARPASPEVRPYTVSINLPDALRLPTDVPAGRFALSPDGQRLALIASDAAGRSMLYIRSLRSRIPQPVAGTEGAIFPFWSPDSRVVAFQAQNKLKTVDVSGGEVVTLGEASFRSPGTWNSDGVILFTPKANSPLFRVAPSGGTPVQATVLDSGSGEVQHAYPFFLPDGRHFLYFVVGSKEGRTVPRGVYVGSLDAKGSGKLIIEGATNAVYANGHLIYLRAGALLAQPFDLDRLELGGEPTPLVEHVQITGPSASDVTGAFTVSQTGVLAYQTASRTSSQLTWFNRTGTKVSTLGEPGDYVDVALSPDDSRVATSLIDADQGTRQIWTFDVARGVGQRVTLEPGDNFGPNWSRPNGDRIVYSALRRGSIHLYEKAVGHGGSEGVVLQDDLGKFNAQPSPDGRFLIYVAGGGIIQRSDIWVLPRLDSGKAYAFLESTFLESQPQFSPDGRWVAYMSNKSGRFEVYLTPFPGRDSEILVSTAGGRLPRWRRDGKELFYVAADGTLTAVAIDATTSRVAVGPARPLFAIQPRTSRLDAFPYDVTSDGRRFLVNTFLDEVTPPITLVINWPER